ITRQASRHVPPNNRTWTTTERAQTSSSADHPPHYRHLASEGPTPRSSPRNLEYTYVITQIRSQPGGGAGHRRAVHRLLGIGQPPCLGPRLARADLRLLLLTVPPRAKPAEGAVSERGADPPGPGAVERVDRQHPHLHRRR